MVISDMKNLEIPTVPEGFGWINKNRKLFCQKLANLISTPFLYQSKLYGFDAEEFFGPKNSLIQVQLAKIGGNPILVARKVWPANSTNK